MGIVSKIFVDYLPPDILKTKQPHLINVTVFTIFLTLTAYSIRHGKHFRDIISERSGLNLKLYKKTKPQPMTKIDRGYLLYFNFSALNIARSQEKFAQHPNFYF